MFRLYYFYLIPFVFTLPVLAKESPKCLESAITQYEMNQCSGVGYKEAEAELERVISKINILYKSEVQFLSNLGDSQTHWLKQRELDLKLRYPKADEPMYYGSVFPMCYAGYKTLLTLKRIAFLKEWLKGHGDGEVCTGSVMHEFYIKNGRE